MYYDTFASDHIIITASDVEEVSQIKQIFKEKLDTKDLQYLTSLLFMCYLCKGYLFHFKIVVDTVKFLCILIDSLSLGQARNNKIYHYHPLKSNIEQGQLL